MDTGKIPESHLCAKGHDEATTSGYPHGLFFGFYISIKKSKIKQGSIKKKADI
jgi:hypothetical protein